jgi:hypothetical protein
MCCLGAILCPACNIASKRTQHHPLALQDAAGNPPTRLYLCAWPPTAATAHTSPLFLHASSAQLPDCPSCIHQGDVVTDIDGVARQVSCGGPVGLQLAQDVSLLQGHSRIIWECLLHMSTIATTRVSYEYTHRAKHQSVLLCSLRKTMTYGRTIGEHTTHTEVS